MRKKERKMEGNRKKENGKKERNIVEAWRRRDVERKIKHETKINRCVQIDADHRVYAEPIWLRVVGWTSCNHACKDPWNNKVNPLTERRERETDRDQPPWQHEAQPKIVKLWEEKLPDDSSQDFKWQHCLEYRSNLAQSGWLDFM